MALVRHDHETRLQRPWDESLFEWPFGRMSNLLRMLDEDTIKVEEFIEGDRLIVRAELPGVDPEKDVDISLADGMLTIRAERREEHKSDERHVRRSELRYGSFSRSIALPAGAKESDIKATYKDGLLEVHVPIAQESEKSSHIQIERQ